MRFLILLLLACPAGAELITGGVSMNTVSASSVAATYVLKSGDTMTGPLIGTSFSVPGTVLTATTTVLAVNVGIGKNPTNVLDIKDPDAIATIGLANASQAADFVTLTAAGGLNFGTGGLSNFLRATSPGFVGIGTTGDPATKLHMSSGTLTVDGTNSRVVVQTDLNANYAVRAENVHGGGYALNAKAQTFGIKIQAASNSSTYALYANNYADDKNLMYLDGDGKLAVLTSTFTVDSTGIVSAPSNPYVRAPVGAAVLTNTVSTKLYFGAPAAGDNLASMYGGASSSGTFTVPTGGAGTYALSYHQYTGATGAGTWVVDFKKNGSAISGCYWTVPTGANGDSCGTDIKLAAGDTIEVWVSQTGTVDLVPNTNSVYSYFTMKKDDL